MRLKFVFFFCLFISATISYSQSFEGEIIYKNIFKSKMQNLTDEQLGLLVGTDQEYFIKGGNYKSIINGQAITMQLYDCNANRIYNKTPKSDTLYWLDASDNADSVLSYEIKKNAGMVLGYECDALVLRTRTMASTMYYSKKFTLDVDRYKNHNYDNWAFYTKQTGALPLF